LSLANLVDLFERVANILAGYAVAVGVRAPIAVHQIWTASSQELTCLQVTRARWNSWSVALNGIA